MKRVPILLGTNDSPNRAAMACCARHPVQCAGTSTCGSSAARSSRSMGPREDSDAKVYAALARSRTVFYTPTVGSTNKQLVEELTHLTHAQPFAS